MAAVIPWHGDKSRNLTSLVFVFWASAVNWAVLAALSAHTTLLLAYACSDPAVRS